MEREKLISLVSAAQQGDGQAMNNLFNAFYNDVYYFALKTVKDDDLACDITQETFVEIINTIGDLHEPAAFVKWMKQITYHQCTRYFKKKKDVLADEDEEGNTIFDIMAEDRTEFIPDAALDQQDFRKTILAMLDELSEEQRAATLLYYYDELSVKQIAQIQGVSEGTVKSRLNYARKSIQHSVETYEKKNNIKLHSFAFLPFMFWLFKTGAEESTAGAASAASGVAAGVSAATGTTITAEASGAATAGATGAAAAGTGIFAKLAAMPLMSKIISGVTAVAIAASGVGLAVSNRRNQPTEPSSAIATDMSGYVVPEDCTYKTADDTYEAGQTVSTVAAVGDKYTTTTYTYICFQDDAGQVGWRASSNDNTLTSYPALEEEINGLPLISLEATFFWHYNMTAAPDIPESVTDLSDTFSQCYNLTKAPQIPDGVTDMSGTFAGCEALTEAPKIPDGVTDMSQTFTGCMILTEAPQIPGSVMNMDYTFSGCELLIAAPRIPAGVTEMRGTFKECTKLTEAPEIPEGVTDMYNTFYGCKKLEKAPKIPDGVVDLSGTFAKCTSLIEAPAIPDHVLYMHSTFSGCSNLEVAPEKLPDGVIDLSFTFDSCYKLVTVPEIPKSVVYMEGTFRLCDSLEIAPTIPESVLDMRYCFFGCQKLSGTVTIHAKLASYSLCDVVNFECENCSYYWYEESCILCSECSECTSYYACFDCTFGRIYLTGSSNYLYELSLTSIGNVTVE